VEKTVIKEPSEYLSFLLRLWRVTSGVGPDPNGEGMVWRVSLQDTLTDDRISFANLEDLVAFLQRKMDVALDVGKDAAESEA
jgi:hypothetical protein